LNSNNSEIFSSALAWFCKIFKSFRGLKEHKNMETNPWKIKKDSAVSSVIEV